MKLLLVVLLSFAFESFAKIKPFTVTVLGPQSLQSVSRPDGAIELSWSDNATNEIEFQVYRYRGDLCGGASVRVTEATCVSACTETAPCSKTCSYTPPLNLPDGLHVSHKVRAKRGQVVSGFSGCSAVTIDRSPPILTISNPTASSAIQGTVSIQATATDSFTSINRVEFSLGGTSQVVRTPPFSASFNTVGLPEGAITLSVSAFDAAGNSVTRNRSLTVDNLPVPLLDDVNGDGKKDIIVVERDRAFILHGPVMGHIPFPVFYPPNNPALEAAVNTIISSEPDTNDHLIEFDVQFAGDTNGDGYADVLVALHGGKQVLLLGSANGIPSTTLQNATALSRCPSNWSQGCRATPVGDVNQDGLSDVFYSQIVAGTSLPPNASRQHILYLGGTVSGANSTHNTILSGPFDDLQSLGDITGDRIAEIAIGTSTRHFILRGTVYGFLNVNLLAPPATSFSMAQIDGATNGILAAGDVNGDRHTDILANGIGGSHILYGPFHNFSTVLQNGIPSDIGIDGYARPVGDLDNNGFDDIVISSFPTTKVLLSSGSGVPPTPSSVIERVGSVSYGDVDNDGFSDLILGNAGGQYDYGRVYVFYGSGHGIQSFTLSNNTLPSVYPGSYSSMTGLSDLGRIVH